MVRKKATEKNLSEQELSQAFEGLAGSFFPEETFKAQGEADLHSYEESVLARLVGDEKQLAKRLQSGYRLLLREVEEGDSQR